MIAVIMAGGKGTRLSNISRDIPKPMFPILGKPVLEYQIESLKKNGIHEIILVVGHLKEVIMNHFGDGSRHGVKIGYIEEKEPLGTAGALYYLKKEKDDFLLLFGDLMLDVDFGRFMDFHRSRGAMITLYGHPNAHPFDSDLIVMGDQGLVTGILSKKLERNFYYHNFVNAGIYCVNPAALHGMDAPVKIDLEKDLIADFIGRHAVYAYKSTEYVRDMGTPDRLEAVEKDVRSGIVSGRCLDHKQRAIFLDRDGTLNAYCGFVRNTAQFSLLPGVADAVKMINASAYLAIVATNQPVVARGEVTFDGLDEIHRKMETELGMAGAYLDDVFFCPHHPHSGYPGEVPELKKVCRCRKPAAGMIFDAASTYNIDLGSSWMIGDTTMDVQTGKNAGMRTILLETGEGGRDMKYEVEPDHVACDLSQAVLHILGRHEENLC